MKVTKPKDWFANAHEDLMAAEALHRLDAEKYIRVIPFHCQQACENAIKGFLSYKKIRYTKIHNIKALAQLIIPSMPELAPLLQDADELTIFAVGFRYPDSMPRPLTLQDSVDALRIAKKTYSELVALIPFDSSFDL